jgi:hypothetical protein
MTILCHTKILNDCSVFVPRVAEPRVISKKGIKLFGTITTTGS